MIFSSYQFIFFFLPITLAGYAIIRNFKAYRLAQLWLIMASFYFYAQGGIKFLPFFMFTVLFNYVMGSLILKSNKNDKKLLVKLLLIIGLAENIGMLAYYKYTDFLLENINRFIGTDMILHNFILPIGISFFTFQLVAYLVDCSRGDAKAYALIDYLMFITFFPQLIVGPIVHHSEIVVQLEDENTYKFNPYNFMLGIFIFSLGCAKKIMIADPLIGYAQDFYSNASSGGFFESWTAVFSYTFSYYFDFSGYGDMAVGLGLLFNIKLPFNFNSPYKARNFADFWRRWNITLSQFLNEYVFKNIYKFGNRSGKLFFAVLVTFVVSGLWHGAGWHFIAWGVANGVLVCFSYMMTLNSKKLPFWLAWTLTFFGVLITRVLFDSQNTTQAIHVYKEMFNISGAFSSFGVFTSSSLAFVNNNLLTVVLIVLSAIIAFGTKNTMQLSKDFKPNWKNAVIAAILLTLALFRMSSVSDFLYFRF